MSRAYVVVGSMGEYSEREVWVAAAHTDETLARGHVELADAWWREAQQRWERAGHGDAPYDEMEAAIESAAYRCPYDAHFHSPHPTFGWSDLEKALGGWQEGPSYSLEDVELDPEMPQP